MRPERVPGLARAVLLIAWLGLVGMAAADDLEAGRQAIYAGEYAKALTLLAPLADRGDAGAQVAIGAMYAQGLGVPLDLETARDWFLKSARQGNEKARSNLLYMADQFLYPEGTERRCRDALAIITELATLGYPRAYTAAGNLLYEGCDEVPSDPAAGVSWWRESAALGDPVAQTNLAVAYASGVGVAQDYSLALELYRKAAEQGHAAGQYGLGVMYEYGEGVEPDRAEARRWYGLAAAQGDPRARERLQQLEEIP